MENLYLIEDCEMQDVEKIKEYNEDFMKANPKWRPFVTDDNFELFLKEIENKKQGIGNGGIKEIFYWFMEEGKIIGSGSIRLNPEIDDYKYVAIYFIKSSPLKEARVMEQFFVIYF